MPNGTLVRLGWLDASPQEVIAKNRLKRLIFQEAQRQKKSLRLLAFQPPTSRTAAEAMELRLAVGVLVRSGP
jgi:hypothetical protein